MTAAPQPTAVEHPESARARKELTFLLQLAYSGELGAARAYAGHHAVLRDRAERNALARILRDELHHRHVILRMLGELGSAPDPRRERKLNRVGRAIWLFARSHWLWRLVPGWAVPPPRATIRERYTTWTGGPRPVVRVRASWVIR